MQPRESRPYGPVTDALGRSENMSQENDKTLVSFKEPSVRIPRTTQDGSALGGLKFSQSSLDQLL